MVFNPHNPIDSDIAAMIKMKAQKFGREFRLQAADVEDVQSHLTVFIIEKAPQLVARKASQKTVIDRALRNEICNLVNHRLAQKRNSRRNITLDDAPTDAFLRTDAILEGTPNRLDMRDAIKRLPKSLQRLAALLRHMTPTEAQRRLKWTRGQVRHGMAMIAKHLMQDSQTDDKSCP